MRKYAGKYTEVQNSESHVMLKREVAIWIRERKTCSHAEGLRIIKVGKYMKEQLLSCFVVV